MKTEFKKTISGFIHEFDKNTQELLVYLTYKMLLFGSSSAYLSPSLYRIEEFLPDYVNKRHIAKLVMHNLIDIIKSEHPYDECPPSIIEEDWNYVKKLSDNVVIQVDVEKREDTETFELPYDVTVWKNGTIVKRMLCEDYLSAVQTFFGEIIDFERNHDYITSSYRLE